MNNQFFEKYQYHILACILAVMFALSLWSMAGDSLIIDEFAHIPAGYSYLKLHDYKLNPEHPPLIKMMAGAPLLFFNLTMDKETWDRRNEWEFGRKFFLLNNKEQKEQLVFWARFPLLFLGLLLCILVFFFARDLYGVTAGLLAAFLVALSPEILAHTHYVTTDLGITLFIFSSVYFFWKFLQDQSKKNIILLGVSIGCALATKYTALFLIPILGLLGIIWFFMEEKKISFPSEKIKNTFKEKRFLQAIGFTALAFCIGAIILIFAYQVTGIAHYFEGLKYVMFHSQYGHLAYLFGERSLQGWWYYFPVAFFFKTPPSVLFLLLASILFWKKLKMQTIKNELFLIIPVLIYFIAFMMNSINIGVRHILPIMPFLFVFASRIVHLKFDDAKKQRLVKIFLVLALLGYVVSQILIAPYYLAYFNIFAGGPEGGKEILIDSNIDWGQDLKRAAEYLHFQGINEVKIQIFGFDSIETYGFKTQDIPCFPIQGTAVISVNALQGITSEMESCFQWIKVYTPIKVIGYSIYIYQIPEEAGIEAKKTASCEEGCKQRCEQNQTEYLESSWKEETDKCSCKCGKKRSLYG